MDSLFSMFKSSKKPEEPMPRHSMPVGKQSKKAKGMPTNPNSIFSYDESNPFGQSEETKESQRQSSPKVKARTGGGIFQNSAGKDKRKGFGGMDGILPRQLDGTLTLNEKQMANGVQKLQDRAKIQQEINDQSSREAILREIYENQMKKKSIKINNIINNQDYIDIEQLRAACWNGIPPTVPAQRCDCWKILLDYMPIDADFRTQTVERKR